MRRVHLRCHTNILKRLLVHACAFNISLLMRTLTGIGTPRSLQGRVAAALTLDLTFGGRLANRVAFTLGRSIALLHDRLSARATGGRRVINSPFTTGC